MTSTVTSRPGKVQIGKPWPFWCGVTAIAIGVCLHLPDFIASSDMHYMMAGMPMSGTMNMGMALIIAGLAAAIWGLFPSRTARQALRPTTEHLEAMDNAPLRPAHIALTAVLGIAIIIDTMKPATLGFVLPGLSDEYGISTRRAAVLPFVALTGTTVGSVLWGLLADRVGRRATILLSGLLFMGTSICGFMPSFGWNLVMCFLMGASAGGLLPTAYALMAESIPAARRSWLVVLQTGLGSVGGYLVAAGAAALLEPAISWRVLWFLGLPSGLLLLLLNRWIPESPRYLLSAGRYDEAHAVMARYGIVVREDASARQTVVEPAQERLGSGSVIELFRTPYTRQTFTVVLYGLAWGLVNWGFITFLPTFIERDGGKVGNLLFYAALLAIPNTLVIAYLYGKWSSKRSMVLYAVLTAGALVGFVVIPRTGYDGVGLIVLIAVLLTSAGGMIAMLAPYTAEVYPTTLRGSGSGISAAASKVGGMIAPPIIGALATTASLRAIAFAAAVPVVGAAFTLGVHGRETAGKPLPEQERESQPQPVVVSE